MATRASRAERRPPRAGVVRELVEILELQRPIAVGVALAAAVIGFTVALIAPGVLPPHPIVGASVGIAAVAIGVVAAVAADAGDRTVRGVRHVRPTGAAVAASGDQPLPQLTAWVTEQLEDTGHVRIAVVAAGTDTKNAGPLAEALGRALADHGNRVLVADLTVEDAGEPGVAEVGRGELRLSQAVEFAPEVDLARVRSGSRLVDALAVLPRVTGGIAGQVDVLLVALPGLRHPGALLGSTAAERSLLLAIEGVSSRVEVLAGIEALETARAPADLVILAPGLRLPAFGDERTATDRDAAAATEVPAEPVGGVAGSGGTDAPAVPEEAAPSVAGEPPGHEPADDGPVDDVERADDAEDEAEDEPADAPGDAPRAPGAADQLLEAEDERFEVPDAHDLAFLDGEDRLPPSEHATEQQLRLPDDGGPDDGATEPPPSPAAGEADPPHDDPDDDPDDDPTAATDGGVTGHDAPTDLGDTAELEPVEVDRGQGPPAAPPAPAADPAAPPVDHAAEEPSAGTYEELQRIAAVVALERDVTTGEDDTDEPPGGAA